MLTVLTKLEASVVDVSQALLAMESPVRISMNAEKELTTAIEMHIVEIPSVGSDVLATEGTLAMELFVLISMSVPEIPAVRMLSA